MGPLPIITEVPDDVDLAALESDLKDDGVAVLNPAHAGAKDDLAGVVQDAQAKGIENFKVIVLAHDYDPDTSLRDLGNQVAKDMGEKTTILTMSPSQVAGYSNGQLSRYQIEKGQDGYTGKLALHDPPKAAQDFVDVAHDATFPWAALTIALVLIVAALAGVARVLVCKQSRAVDAARRAAGLRSDAAPSAVEENGAIGAGSKE
ncbi:DUF6676 family protein [Tsukamurella sp. 1534]|uniref:Rv1476 family membrane protein n=1 Tax=Tsukamurella sp. 1534 TaxID=1151061 RepID=UPI0002F23E03|nr:DUF6676 family protein [Tsukamurella sp. 1534]